MFLNETLFTRQYYCRTQSNSLTYSMVNIDEAVDWCDCTYKIASYSQ
jgi:hypothetical protein